MTFLLECKATINDPALTFMVLPFSILFVARINYKVIILGDIAYDVVLQKES